MGIDGIGKGGGGVPPVAPDATQELEKKSKVDKPFSVEKPADATKASSSAATTHVEGASATSPLARLKAGEIDVERYMDLKVDEATKGLKAMPPSQLDEIKRMLRDQMATDPGLADLVKMSTGHMPKPPTDE